MLSFHEFLLSRPPRRCRKNRNCTFSHSYLLRSISQELLIHCQNWELGQNTINECDGDLWRCENYFKRGSKLLFAWLLFFVFINYFHRLNDLLLWFRLVIENRNQKSDNPDDSPKKQKFLIFRFCVEIDWDKVFLHKISLI